MRDFIGFGIGIDLPIYNRNQGNIKLAKAQVEQQKMQLNAVNIELETSISKLTKQLKAYENLLNQFPSTAMQEFQSMMENYVKHLKSKQVSLFEFIDFADSFLQSQSKYYEIEKNYFETFEQIQYLIGKDL
jgi:cobalt-zinc-cadmium efflux system outer membrane protein